MSSKNSISIKIEQFYQEVYAQLIEKHGNYSYKNVELSEIAIKFYLNKWINNTLFFDEITASKTDEQWQYLTHKYVQLFENKVPFTQKIQCIVFDLLRYLRYFFSSSVAHTSSNYYFFITNKKFINYTQGIRKNLNDKGISTGLLLWEKSQLNDTLTSVSNLPKVAFPYFWTSKYFQFREYNHLVDRVLGYQALFHAKKVILVEGCVLSEHIVAVVCKSKKIPTVCIQWGFFAKTVTQAGWRNMPFDRFITWGTFYTNQFKMYNTLDVKEIGHPTLKEEQASSKEQVVLFAVQKVMDKHITAQDIFSFINYAIDIAKKHTTFKIVIRSHPDFKIPLSYKEEHKNLENLVWHDYQDFSLQKSLEIAKYCVSISSTVSLESLVFGCYPLFITANNLPLQLHTIFDTSSGFTHVVDYSNFEEVLVALEQKEVQNYLSGLKKEFYSSLGNEAIEKIAIEILQ